MNIKEKLARHKYIGFLLVFIFYFSFKHWVNYENPEVIKAEVRDYLSEKYKVEFELSEPENVIHDTWHIYATPIDNEDVKALIIWEKHKTPHITYDFYTNAVWRSQAYVEAEKYFKNLYEEDTDIFFLFQCKDHDFSTSEIAKNIDYQEVIKRKKQSIMMEVQCYVFIEDEIDREEEARKIETVVKEYFEKMASDWDYSIFYLSKDFKDKFKIEFNSDFNYLRTKGSKEYKKMYEKGQLLEWFHSYHFNEESQDLKWGEFYFDDN